MYIEMRQITAATADVSAEQPEVGGQLYDNVAELAIGNHTIPPPPVTTVDAPDTPQHDIPVQVGPTLIAAGPRDIGLYGVKQDLSEFRQYYDGTLDRLITRVRLVEEAQRRQERAYQWLRCGIMFMSLLIVMLVVVLGLLYIGAIPQERLNG